MVAWLGSSRKIPSSDMAGVDDIPEVSVTIGSELVYSGDDVGVVVT